MQASKVWAGWEEGASKVEGAGARSVAVQCVQCACTLSPGTRPVRLVMRWDVTDGRRNG